MRRLFLLLLAASFLLPLAPATTAAQPPESVLQRIEAARESGELNREEALINKALAIFDHKKLPQRFQRPEISPPVKNGTAIIRELKREFETVSPEAKEKLRPYLFRGKKVGKAKIADATRTPARKTVLDSHMLPNWRETQNFNIEWGNSGLDTTDLDSNTYPDVIDRWAEYLEASWTEIVELMGYTPPKGSGTYLVDVYIGNTGDGSFSISPSWYGYADTYSDPMGVPYMVMNNDYSWAPPNDDPDGRAAGAMKVTAAHEFFHTSHFAMDYWEDSWWMEASATWMEDAVYDGVNDYYNYLNSWPLYPNASLLLFNGGHEYGDVIWSKYLSEQWGGDDAIKSVWDNCTSVQGSSSVSAMEDFFISYSSTLSEAFKDFTVKNIFMDYEEGAQYGDMDIRATLSSYSTSFDSSTYVPGYDPDYLGANYIKLITSSGFDVVLDFDGEEDFNSRTIAWGAMIAKETSGGYEVSEIALDPAGSGSVDINGFGTYQNIYLIPSALSETGLSPSETIDGPSYTFTVHSSIVTAPAAAPELLEAIPDIDTVFLSWSSVPAASSYNVYRQYSGSLGFRKVNKEPVLSNTFSDASATEGETYYYAVTWDNGSGSESAYSTLVSATPTSSADVDAPATPSGVSITEDAACSAMLSWTPGAEPDLKGHILYYGETSGSPTFRVAAGSTGTVTVNGLAPATFYYFALSSYDDSGNESVATAEVSHLTSSEACPDSPVTSVSGGGSDGGFCFIATAAYGYYDEPHVMLLRAFRDRYLMTNSLGRAFVDFYYRVSPDLAMFIAGSELLKTLVRAFLLPLIGLSWIAIEAPLLLPVVSVLSLLLLYMKLFYKRDRTCI